jgi:hypothetical protein
MFEDTEAVANKLPVLVDPPPFAANKAYDAVVANEAVPCNDPVKDPDKLKG